jgi:adenosylhomocysteine nucleosidase
LSFEARVAAGPGVSVLCGTAQRYIDKLESAVQAGGSGIISIGIAGGLAPGLAPGDWVIASGVVADGVRIPTDSLWSQRLLSALPDAVYADISGSDGPVVARADKRKLHESHGTVAVDMESHIAAKIASRHGVPFAACRVIIDPAERTLPPAALVGMRDDGRPDVFAVMPAAAPDVRAAARGGRCPRGADRAIPWPQTTRREPELPGYDRDRDAARTGDPAGLKRHRCIALEQHGRALALQDLIDVDLDRAGEHRLPGLQIGLHAGIAGELLAVHLDLLRSVVFDLLEKAAGIVDVLKEPHLSVAEHLIERCRRLHHRDHLLRSAGQAELEMQGTPDFLLGVCHVPDLPFRSPVKPPSKYSDKTAGGARDGKRGDNPSVRIYRRYQGRP